MIIGLEIIIIFKRSLVRETFEKNNKSRLEKQRTSLRDEIAKLLNLKMSCSETAISFLVKPFPVLCKGTLLERNPDIKSNNPCFGKIFPALP